MITAKELVNMRNALTEEYYEGLKVARKEGHPIAHITGHMPQEILYSMGIMPAYPENYAPLIASQGYARELCQAMEEKEYSPEVCGYAAACIGSMFVGKGPFGGLPVPDVVISSPNMCSSHPEWWDITAKYYGVPHFLLDAPHTNADPQERHIAYLVDQMKEMIQFLEKTLNLTFSEEKMRERVALADEANKYYMEILQMMTVKPSPLSFRDLCGHIFPICVLSGTTKAVEFYKALRDFVADRVEKGIGAIEDERYRLAWDNIAIWHDMKVITYLEERHATVVYSNYASGTWGQRYDLDHPFESMARRYMIGWVCRLVDSQIEMYRKKTKEYSLGGVIFHVNRGCRPYTAGQYDLARSLKEKDGMPSLMIEGNMADPRGYSGSETRRMIDEFIELLD